jgi:hypothetical protein
MYEAHPLITEPPASAKLWRYMDVTKLISLLHTSSLFFARADRFLDSWEGAISESNILAYQAAAGGLPGDQSPILELPRIFRGFRKHTYISCWHQNEYESDAMWQLYLKSNEGVAIQTTLQSLKASLNNYSNHPVYIGLVQYLDYSTRRVPDGHSFGPFLHKRVHFVHENEVRAIIQVPPSPRPDPTIGPAELHIEDDAVAEYGLTVPVDLTVLIENIYLAPGTHKWIREALHGLLTRYQLHLTPHQSALGEPPVSSD